VRSSLNLERQKLRARRLEEKGQVQKAIEAYVELLRDLEGKPELASELALFNKVGDLYLKASMVPEAVEMYERAATLYADLGFPNNAIALCNKVLRNAPGRTHVYLRLAQLMVERGFVAEAKQNLLEYADRMQKAGKTDEAFRALQEFADLSPENEEIRLLLAEQLKAAARTTEAREQLAKLFHEARASGDERRSRRTLAQIKAIDPEFDPRRVPKPKIKERKEKSSDLVFLDLDEAYRGEEAGTAESEEKTTPHVSAEALEVEPTVMGGEDRAADVVTLDGLDVQREFQSAPFDAPGLEVEQTFLTEEELGAEVGAETEAEPEIDDFEDMELPELDDVQTALEDLPLLEIPDEGVRVRPSDAKGLGVPELDVNGADTLLEEQTALEEEEEEEEEEREATQATAELEDAAATAEAAAEEVAAAGAAEETEDLVEEGEEELTFPTEAPPSAPVATAPDVGMLEAAVADDPDSPRRHVALAEALAEAGQRDRALEELDIALALFERGGDWGSAEGLVDEIIRLEPNSVRHHQKRVEHAYRTGDKRRLVETYLGLGDALVRAGVLERAQMVYKRVLEHDPNSAQAKQALAALAPAQPAEPVSKAASAKPQGEFVDLGALVLEDEVARDTRMRVEDEEPTGDEERDFAEMLSQFKRGIEANIAEEDWQAHYDLGVAFKEMGLLDEAIAEFQKALRSAAGRLRTAEALGSCFFEKAQYSVAATVMRRAVETDPSGDDAKIGLLYWLGRCGEEMGRHADAVACYQRVFALDIRFRDVAERVKRLSGAGH
jgi:tetratricopeptide (TPR) repeat protein